MPAPGSGHRPARGQAPAGIQQAGGCYRVKLGYSDTDRARIALKGIGGKRLTYRPTRAQVATAQAYEAATAAPF